MNQNCLPLRDFMQLAQLLGGVSIETDVPDAGDRLVDPIGQVQMSQRQFVQVFEALAHRVGLACVHPDGDEFRIRLVELAADEPRLPEEEAQFLWPEAIEEGDESMVFTSFEPLSIDAAHVAEILGARRFDCAVAHTETALLLQGRGRDVLEAVRFLIEIDTSSMAG